MISSITSEQHLARIARQIASGSEVLFHGTRYARAILDTGELQFASTGDPVVAFTRCPIVASYFACLERDDDEGRGAIFIFDRRSLGTRFRLEPYRDADWECGHFLNDEAEERVWDRDIPIGPHLIGSVSDSSVMPRRVGGRRILDSTKAQTAQVRSQGLALKRIVLEARYSPSQRTRID